MQKKTLDNQVHESVDMQKTFKAKLSITRKKLEAQRITHENRRILQRIQEVPPVYNHVEWEVAAKEREHTIKNMLLYPEVYEKRVQESSSTRRLPQLQYTASSDQLSSPLHASSSAQGFQFHADRTSRFPARSATAPSSYSPG